MGDEDTKKPGATPEDVAPEPAADDATGRTEDRRISDFVRRAVSAGVGAARSSKDDIMRAAAGEVRNWLEHLNLNDELAKALSKMVIEVKTEIRFRPAEDGRMVPETTNEVKVKPPSR
ncbi:MAG TPA: hypothetical protein VLT58_13455 [Polyangia bacterium]|nr:hypothetical protein [Polyangia bacterium]